MNKENFKEGEEFTLCENDLLLLLRQLLFHGGKVFAEITLDDVDINCFKVKINKK